MKFIILVLNHLKILFIIVTRKYWKIVHLLYQNVKWDRWFHLIWFHSCSSLQLALYGPNSLNWIYILAEYLPDFHSPKIEAESTNSIDNKNSQINCILVPFHQWTWVINKYAFILKTKISKDRETINNLIMSQTKFLIKS